MLVSRSSRAPGSRAPACRRPPSSPLRPPFFHSFRQWRKERGRGGRRPPAGRRSALAGGARGGPAQLAGHRGRLPNRAGERLAQSPWHQR
jgi:hypothetical protein